MSAWLTDATVAHLRDVADWPDLGARYEITSRIGHGATAAVYEARDLTLGRAVAVKVLALASAAGRVDLAARLLDEARILGRLEHPGIVPVHDAGTLPDGRVFYVMKLVRGKRLDAALDPAVSQGRRLELFLRICDAVSFAHAHGIIHRDLKPENIMIGAFGEVLVMDWGAAQVAEAARAEGRLVVGTPGFMPPEQEAGDTHAIDARSDVFSLGALLDTLLVPPVPRPLQAIARKAKAASRENRYQSVEELSLDVARFRDGRAVAAYRESAIERVGRFYRRYRVPILLVIAYMVMRVILLLWFRV